MTELELHKLGFRSQEHYDEAMNAVKFAGSGKYSAPGGTGLFFSEKEQSLLDQRKQLASNCDDWLSYKSCTSADMFPPSCDLSGELHSHIFDQGNRGTCLAQTLAALASYYFGQKEILSPEYIFACLKSYEHDRFAALYNDFFTKNPNPPALEKFTQIEKIKYADQLRYTSGIGISKELAFVDEWEKYLSQKVSLSQKNFREESDWKKFIEQIKETSWKEFAECIKVNRDPFNQDGAFYDMAYQVFSHKGFASWNSWPYSAKQILGNSGHLPIPQEALADAEKRKITDQIYLFSSGGSIDEIKKFLTGNHGRQRPMPVAIGILCFNSWNCNPYTKKWGWINMPVYDEIKGFIAAIERNNGMSFTEFFKQIFSVLSPNFQNMIVAKLNENHCSLEDADPYYLAFLLYASEDGKKICRQLESDICYLKEKYSQFPNLWETPLD